MASTCPNCGKKLHFWNIKAECSSCGVSIPNYNWVERLEEDSVHAEQAFESFYKTMNRLAYSLWGTKLRIARLVVTFLPAIGYLLPWAVLKSDGESFDLSIISISGRKSLIDFFQSFFGDMNLFINNMKFENYGGPLTLAAAGYLLFAVSLLFIVIAFFLNLIMFRKPNTKSTIVFDILSIGASVASVICFVLSGGLAEQAVAFNFGELAVLNGTTAVSWGYFAALVLLLAATVVNILVAKAPAKTDEVLESERVARKTAKEEKEKAAEEKKAIAREEAAQKAAEEQKQRVEQAKAKLAEKEKKKKS